MKFQPFNHLIFQMQQNLDNQIQLQYNLLLRLFSNERLGFRENYNNYHPRSLVIERLEISISLIEKKKSIHLILIYVKRKRYYVIPIPKNGLFFIINEHYYMYIWVHDNTFLPLPKSK